MSGADAAEAARTVTPAAEPPAPDGRVIRHHRRFALSDVTLDGEPVGGATIDAWETGSGIGRWSARVLMPAGDARVAGELAGRLRDGATVRGSVALIGPGPTVGTRGPMLTEWQGTTALRRDANPPAAERRS